MSNENIFREIDEELRTDRMRALWRRFAPFVIGGAIAIVALVAVNEGWSWYTKSQSAAASEEFYGALNAAEAGNLDEALAQLDTLAANGSGGYPVLAEFRKAALLSDEGDAAGAVAAYDTLANNRSNPRLRELALLLAANILVDHGTLADVEARIATLATDDNHMRRVARELLGLAQYKAGDYAAAEESFQAVIDDPLAQSGARNRMAYYLAQMLAEGTVAAEEPAEAAAGPDGADNAEDAVQGQAAPAEEPAAE
ncbi:tetratricopeptide repeat protein [Devosia sp. XK-2]|uniref:tetratricopeptide repeat protein n=1 Tax=Devosia sp. XK-2 TaxID=3126689 RepID=UPI0030D2225C